MSGPKRVKPRPQVWVVWEGRVVFASSREFAIAAVKEAKEILDVASCEGSFVVDPFRRILPVSGLLGDEPSVAGVDIAARNALARSFGVNDEGVENWAPLVDLIRHGYTPKLIDVPSREDLDAYSTGWRPGHWPKAAK